jgi:acyl-coenzyme A synthetase/AMP-(fatty) acid ligase
VPASQGKRELASIAARVRPAVCGTKERFRDRDFASEADEIFSQLGSAPLRIAVPNEGLLRLDGAQADERAAVRLEEPAHALSTSGSEGIPKLAIYTLAAACERAHAQARLLGLAAEDIFLKCLPARGRPGPRGSLRRWPAHA